jgi:hypothetical protein
VELDEGSGELDNADNNSVKRIYKNSWQLRKLMGASNGNYVKLITYLNYIETLGSLKCVKISNKILEKFWRLWQKCQIVVPNSVEAQRRLYCPAF